MRALTANCTSYGTFAKLLDWVAFNLPTLTVLCAQETKVTADEVAAWSAKLFILGWKSFWEPCLFGGKAGKSAGVVTLIRKHLSCGWLPSLETPGRAVGCFLEGCKMSRINVANIYLVSGLETSDVTKAILGRVGNVLRISSGPWT